MASERSTVTHRVRALRAVTLFTVLSIFAGPAGLSASADSRDSKKQALQVTSQKTKPEATAFLTGTFSSLPSSAARPDAKLVSVPLSFEPNLGQSDASVQFLSRGSGYALFLTPGEVVLNLERQESAPAWLTPIAAPLAAPVDTLRMELLGANANAAAAAASPQPGVVSYLIDNDPKQWHSGVPTYGKVNYAQIYPGVDLVFYGNQRQLEYDFVVAPGADPGRIAWQMDGANVSIDAEGNLVLEAANGPASFKKPVLYQMDGDKKTSVDGSFTVAGNQIRFRIGEYDRSKALVIDPVLSYASYLGGTNTDNIGYFLSFGTNNATTQGLAVDAAGSIYVTGYTYSTDFPTHNPYKSTQPAKMSGSSWPSVFVTKFSPDGSSLVYSTYLGGNGLDYGYAIAVDSSGEAYITGSTTSPDFPVTAGAYQTICSPEPGNGGTVISDCSSFYQPSAFVTKLNPTGTGLVYSTFLGGLGNAGAVAIALDPAGRAYVAGNEQAENCASGYSYTCFPTTTGAVISAGETTSSQQFAFLAVFDPTGAKLLYSTLFGDLNGTGTNANQGSGITYATGVTVDASGNFYLIGSTKAGKLPTTAGVLQPTSGPLYDGVSLYSVRGLVAKFYPVTATGTTLEWATYLGGTALSSTSNLTDYTSGIVADAAGNSYITGFTESPNFPVTSGSYQPTCAKQQAAQYCESAYVVKLNSAGSAILWGTFLGGLTGSGDNVVLTGPIQLDGNGNVYIVGETSAGSFPVVNPIEPNAGGFQEAFVAEFDPTGSHLLFSTPIGNGGVGNNSSQ